jgi:hypothetical protein
MKPSLKIILIIALVIIVEVIAIFLLKIHFVKFDYNIPLVELLSVFLNTVVWIWVVILASGLSKKGKEERVEKEMIIESLDKIKEYLKQGYIEIWKLQYSGSSNRYLEDITNARFESKQIFSLIVKSRFLNSLKHDDRDLSEALDRFINEQKNPTHTSGLNEKLKS